MKALRYVIYAFLGLLVLAILGAVIFAATFDPNRYKGQIEAAVKEQTGRALKLQGDLKVAFFPSLGAQVENVILTEKDPSQEFLSLEQAHGSVAVMPLLRGEVVVDRIRVSGLRAQAIKGKDGRFNFQDLLEAKDATAQKPQTKPDEGAKGEAGAVKFDIAGIDVERSAISYKDLATGQTLALTDLNLSTGRVAEKAEGKLQFSTVVKGTQPAMDVKVSLAGGYKVDLPAKAYALSGVEGAVQGSLDKDSLTAKISAPKVDIAADKATGEAIAAQFSLKGAQRTAEASLNIAGIEGSAKALAIPKLSANIALSGPDMPRALKVPLEGSVRANLEKETLDANLSSRFDESNIQAKLGLAKFSPPSYLFDVNVDRLNVDQYFPPEKKPAAGAEKDPGKDPSKGKSEDAPVDLSALESLTANGKLQVGALQARGLKLANVKAEVKAANGRLDVSPHSADLYQGSVTGALSVQAKGNRVAVKETLTNVAIGPLLRDFAQQDRLEGRGNVSLDVGGAGPTVEAIKKSLDGTAKVNLRDGAVKGVDIAGLLRKVKSLGKSDEGAADSKQQTDFSEMNATFVIKDGVATNKDLDIKAPLLRVTGAGAINIGNSTMDYTAKAAVVASAKGQGGAGLDDLAGITVPVQLTGPFDALKYKVDFGAVAADVAKTRVGEKVKERVEESREKVEDKVKDRLKGLLKR
jgi:AsmA protein